MRQIQKAWYFYFIEPFTWIFYCFFQPVKFRRDIEVDGFVKRFRCLCRMGLPLFACTYPLALCTRLLLCLFFPKIYADYIDASGVHFLSLIFDATWALPLGIGVAIVGGAAFRLSYGIAGAMTAGLWGGVAVHTLLGAPGYLAVASTVVSMLGFIVGIAIGSARDITNSSAVGTSVKSFFGLLLGIPSGFPSGIAGAYVGGMTVYHELPVSLLIRSGVGSTLGAILGALFGAISAGIIVGIIRESFRTRILTSGIEHALSLGTAACIAASAITGGVMGTTTGAWGEEGVAVGFSQYLVPNLPLVVSVFVVSYILGYYRLPLYPFSGLSSIEAYLASRNNPPKVFDYLHRSSLYWDEGVFLPLPGLKRTFYRALEQDTERTLQEIAFVVAQRPSQITEVQPVAREIAIRDLETRENVQLIAQASERLAEMIPQEAKLIDPRWQLPFVRLDDTSREAARYCTPLGHQQRRDTLNQIPRDRQRDNLKK